MKNNSKWMVLSLSLALFGTVVSGCNSQPEPAAETHKEGDGHDHKEGEKH